jgi:DNA repair exonuclease SbcCD nuclease subunit
LKFIHTADLHLDSPLRGLARYPGAPVDEIRGATRRAFENLVHLAATEAVDLVVIAGDVYDGDWRDYRTGLFFAAQMSRLREAGVPVLMVSGNHDARSIITRALRLPDNVRHFSANGPETALLDDLGVAVHGHGYAERWVLADLSAGYPSRLPGYFNVGLLHTSASTSALHETYAPCTVGGLVARGYDYWALGHVHERQVLHEEPWVVFPGCIQGRHAQETGAKGCTVVDVEDLRVSSVRHVPVDVVRWASLVVDVDGLASATDAVDAVRTGLGREVRAADGRLLAIRVELTGASAVHEELWADSARWESEIRAAATDIALEGIWVERVLLRTSTRADLATLRSQDGPLGALLASLGRYGAEPDLLAAELGSTRELTEIRELAGRLAHETELAAELDLGDPGPASRLLGEVQGLLLTHLQGEVAG